MEAEAIGNLLFLVRLGLVTVALWIASRGFDLWQDMRRRASDRDAFIRAIYAEVDFNTFDMKRFLDATIPLTRLAEVFATRPGFVPHITDARHTDVYKSRIEDLHLVVAHAHLQDQLVGDLVRFYGELEKIIQQIEGLQKESFKMISNPGKVATIGQIYTACAACERLGIAILGEMEVRFRHLKLARNDGARPFSATGDAEIGEIKQRLTSLSSHLDRIDRTRHK